MSAITRRPVVFIAATALIASPVVFVSAGAASADVGSSIVAAATPQVGAGPCGYNGGGYYATGTGQSNSCSGGGEAHAWCADFAGWVWQQAGVADLGGLNDLAQSLYDYGKTYGTTSNTPAVGDVVYYHPETESLSDTGDDHAAIVVAVNSDNTIDTVGGNEGGGDGVVQEDYDMPGTIGSGVWEGGDGAEVDVYSFIAPVNQSPAGQIMFWHLSNSNSSGLQSQPTIPYGDTPDIPVTGDWTDQGYDTPGVFEQATATWNLDYNFNGGTGSVEFPFGAPGDLPVVGDWDGPSHGTEVGVYRQSDYTFYLQRADGSVTVIPYGNGAGWYPIAGDWTGQGYDSVGLFVPSTTGGPNAFYLRDGLGADPATISLTLGDPGDEPIVGDWDNSGHTSIGVYRPSTYQFVEQLSSGSAANPTTLNAIRYGNPYSEPVIGHWSVGAPDTIGVIMGS